MSEHKVREGVYIPPQSIETQWPKKPDEQVLKPVHLVDVIIDENYPFLDKSFNSLMGRMLVYLAIFTIGRFMQWFRYGLKIKGRKNLRKNKKLFKNGALTVCNHVYRWDFLAVVQAVKHSLWFPALAANLEGKDRRIIRGAGGIPVAKKISGMKKFYEAFDELHAKKKWIHVFPESCQWRWYQPLRPFKRGGFEFAYRYNIPVIPMAISFRKRSGFRKFFDKDKPLVTIAIGEPFMPDLTLSKKQDAIRMRELAFNQMLGMAGIVQNQWPCEGD